GLARWFAEYNNERPHQGLNYATPAQYYLDPDGHGARPVVWA
ncbi:MAG: transposase, partial [Verrucomicrobia bacterium]|nr:transposase [Verrucomicrobiota bacterium]